MIKIIHLGAHNYEITLKNIALKLIDLNDATFILNMRLNENKTKFLSKIEASIKAQENYIKNYLKLHAAGKEYYFKICEKNTPIGLVRIYDLKNDSFCWGSWIIDNGAPKTAGILSAFCVYEFGFYGLNFPKSHFDVRLQNSAVIRFHRNFGAKAIKSDELNIYFTFSKIDFEKAKIKYARFIETKKDSSLNLAQMGGVRE